jgi:hypothetical protein
VELQQAQEQSVRIVIRGGIMSVVLGLIVIVQKMDTEYYKVESILHSTEFTPCQYKIKQLSKITGPLYMQEIKHAEHRINIDRNYYGLFSWSNHMLSLPQLASSTFQT